VPEFKEEVPRRELIKIGLTGLLGLSLPSLAGCGSTHNPHSDQPSIPSGHYNGVGRAELYVPASIPSNSREHAWILAALQTHLSEYENDWGPIVQMPSTWTPSTGVVTPQSPIRVRAYRGEVLHHKYAESSGSNGYWHNAEVRVALSNDLTAPGTYHFVLHQQLWATQADPTGDHNHTRTNWAGLPAKTDSIRRRILANR